MPALGAGIQRLYAAANENVDGQDEPGHDAVCVTDIVTLRVRDGAGMKKLASICIFLLTTI